MTPPKFIRRWKYKRLLKKLIKYKYREDTFLCNEFRYTFPFIEICNYPEMWSRRTSAPAYHHYFNQVWFHDNYERIEYVQEALDILNNKNNFYNETKTTN